MEVAVILAAGASRRLGAPKQLLRLPNGRSLVRHSVEQALAAGPARCAVVTGNAVESIAETVRGLDVALIASDAPEEGIAASIRAAAAWADAQSAQALLLSVCDQPLLTARHLTELLAAWRRRQRLAASYYAGKPAVPAVFPRRYFQALRALHGDQGARALLASAPELELVAWPEGALDIDTAEDWAKVSGAAEPA